METKKYHNQIKTKIPVKVITAEVVGKEGMEEVNRWSLNRNSRRMMATLSRRSPNYKNKHGK